MTVHTWKNTMTETALKINENASPIAKCVEDIDVGLVCLADRLDTLAAAITPVLCDAKPLEAVAPAPLASCPLEARLVDVSNTLLALTVRVEYLIDRVRL